jgi:hypothetical protein
MEITILGCSTGKSWYLHILTFGRHSLLYLENRSDVFFFEILFIFKFKIHKRS